MPDFTALLKDPKNAQVFVYALLNAVNQVPELLNCTKASLLKSIIYLAQIDLMPNTPENHAYLIPFGKVCTVVIGYPGFIELAHRSGYVKKIFAELVYENDEFQEILGSNARLIHNPKHGDRGKQIGAYAMVVFENGAEQWEYLDNDQLKKIHNSSKCPNSPAWKAWPDQMDRKGPIRRLWKYIPKTPAMALARALDDAAAAGEDQDMPFITPADYTIEDDDPQTTKSDKLAGELKAKNGNGGKKPEPEKQPEPGPEPKKEPPVDRAALEKELTDLLESNADVLGPDIIAHYPVGRIKLWKADALQDAINEVNKQLVAVGQPEDDGDPGPELPL
jgi:phage RecT family recombinase